MSRATARRATGALAVAVAATVAATGSSAAGVPRAGSVAGGPLLASRGVVVRPLAGAPALPAPKSLPAASWLVADATTGQVLAAKNPHGRYLPASTLKMLTAVTLIPRLSPDQKVRVTNAEAGIDGSRVGLVPGMRYSVRQLFTAMLVVSANDAAQALAEAAGGVKPTLDAMNAEARHLQAYDTLARTPSGLDGVGESSSAYDLALIARAGLAMPAFRHYIGVVHSRMPAPHHKHFAIYTHNQLLTTYPGDIGVKNGYTVAADGTYVGAARRHGHVILVSLMHANPNFWPMARALLNWGFKADGRVSPVGTLVPPATAVTAPVAGASGIGAAPAASVTHHSGAASPLELALIVVTATALALSGFGRLRRRRRRPSRLRLPPAY